MISLGEKKGFSFAGTTSTGCNAFFVRNDLISNVTDCLSKIYSFLSAFRESRDTNGSLTFVSGAQRRDLISDLPLVETETGIETTLNDLVEVYTSEWLSSQCTSKSNL